MDQDDEPKEPVIGCFPCIKRLMLVIMLGTVIIEGFIINTLKEEKDWSDIVFGEHPFKTSARLKDNHTFFAKKHIDMKNADETIKNIWGLLNRKHETEIIIYISVLSLFLSIVLAHFVGFCFQKNDCFLKRSYRILTYLLYTAGAALFFIIGIMLYLEMDANRSNYKDVADKLNAIPDKSLSLVNDNDKSITTFRASDLSRICLICHHNARLTIMDMMDFRHVFPQMDEYINYRIINIDAQYYIVDDLINLGFCTREFLSVFTIFMSGFVGLIFLSIPLIGLIQLNMRMPKLQKAQVLIQVASQNSPIFIQSFDQAMHEPTTTSKTTFATTQHTESGMTDIKIH